MRQMRQRCQMCQMRQMCQVPDTFRTPSSDDVTSKYASDVSDAYRRVRYNNYALSSCQCLEYSLLL